MAGSGSSAGRAIPIVRWVARILSALFIILCLILFVGEVLFREPQSSPLTANAILQLTLMGFWLAGLALAWKWEAIGGSIALAAYVIVGIINPKAFVLLPVPLLALVFLTCWWMDRKHNRQGSTVASPR
jgi:uncharacterized membrane protein